VKRPAWAAAGSFASAWSSFERRGIPTDDLALSRPITLTGEQVAALPVLQSPVGTAFTETPLPFPTVYLDLGAPEAHVPFDLSNPEVGLIKILPQAVLISDLPFEKGEKRHFATWINQDGRVHFAGHGYMDGTPGDEILRCWEFVSPNSKATGEAAWRLKNLGERTVQLVLEKALAVFGWMQSYNVELVETPLSPRQRKREVAKGRQIALTVEVKQSKRYTSASQSSGSANYTHRFETRGHYAREFELKDDGTPNKNFARYMQKRPDDVIVVDGRACFQKWIPPHVKGPFDKPFVPKVREVVA
jgi:hypothetical protein